MYDHMTKHSKMRLAHKTDSEAPLWAPCRLQTYFTAKGRIDYFVVEGNAEEEAPGGLELPEEDYVGPRPSSPEFQLLDGLKADIRQASQDLEGKAAVVEDLGQGRGDREPWLVHTGFPMHLRGLRDVEIRSSFKLPKNRSILLLQKTKVGRGVEHRKEKEKEDHDDDDDGDSKGGHEKAAYEEDGEADLRRILAAVDALLRKAYNLVADRSLERKMTHQRAQRLSDFASGSGKKGRDISFRCFKRESTLTTYFRRMKELLVYYYRVAYREDGHFTGRAIVGSGQKTLPQDVIESTQAQREAMDKMFEVLRLQDDDDHAGGEDAKPGLDLALEHAVRTFYTRLICDDVGSACFRSPVLSFCAMISRTAAYRGTVGVVDDDDDGTRGGDGRGWPEPGNYSSHLSGLVWTAQLLLFEAVCFRHRDDERRVPATLGRLCQDYMHQKGETAFGYILQWRLYLGAVAKSAITRRQARWSWDGTEITYLGSALRLRDVSQLIVSEYRRARDLLFGDLMFGARDLGTVEAWRLKDDIDTEHYGGSWLTDARNSETLLGSKDALLKQIECRADSGVCSSGTTKTTKTTTVPAAVASRRTGGRRRGSVPRPWPSTRPARRPVSSRWSRYCTSRRCHR